MDSVGLLSTELGKPIGLVLSLGNTVKFVVLRVAVLLIR